MPSLQRLNERLAVLDRGAGAFANLCQFAIMVIVFTDVFARYVLNVPIEWVYDVISRYLMVALFFFSLSWTLGTGEHVRVLFFRQFVTRRTRRIFDLLAAILGGAAFALIFVAGFDRFWRDWTSGDVYVGAYLWPNWIASICVPLGVGIMCLRFALMIVASAVAAATDTDPLQAGDDALF